MLAIVVLDRRADGAGLGYARDRFRNAACVGRVPVLEIDRDGQVRRAVERCRMLDDFVQRRFAVLPAERVREAGARARERLKAERCEHASGSGVPRVRDHERVAAVEVAERFRLLLLAHPAEDTRAKPLGVISLIYSERLACPFALRSATLRAVPASRLRRSRVR